MWKGHHGGLDDIRVGKKGSIDMHDCDVLSATNDDVLRPPHDVEAPFLVQATKISGGHPAVRIDGGSGLAPVAAHRCRRPSQDLSDAIGIRVLDLDFDDRQWLPYASRPALHL